MQTIKIFLASSEELDYYRMAFGNLVRRLDDMYEKRGVRIKLFEWEDYDAAYNDRRKQDEYNDFARKSDLFIALFYTKANEFTVEEFNVALDEYNSKKAPKIYVYCKDTTDETVSQNLIDFQKRLSNELQYYWCRFDNRESLQFHFVMQLQLMENDRIEDLKIKDGTVTFKGLHIAKIENLKFAAANEKYQKMREELAGLPEKIEKTRKLFNKFPKDKDLEEDLQQTINRYNKLKEDFEMHQQLLFNTAKRVAQLQGKRITERMRRAMDALNEGKVHMANIILDDAEEDAYRNLEEYRQSKEITEQKRQNLFCSIEELQLKASTIMADTSISAEKRIHQIEMIYTQADLIAQECDYDKEKHIKFLCEYIKSLYYNSRYVKALEISERLIHLCQETYGKDHTNTLELYTIISNIYLKLGNKTKAQEFLSIVQE